MRSITAGVSLGMNSAARRFSSSCETREAPVITVETFGLRAHHAIASCASVQPSSFATASSLPTVSFFALIDYPIRECPVWRKATGGSGSLADTSRIGQKRTLVRGHINRIALGFPVVWQL